MKIIIDIPNHEFDNDVKDKFQDYFSRVKADLRDYPSHDKMCGNYEMETTELLRYQIGSGDYHPVMGTFSTDKPHE